jgi:hypothetical protein
MFTVVHLTAELTSLNEEMVPVQPLTARVEREASVKGVYMSLRLSR